ncbi:hypothetical protein [Amycolatopsis sp. CB00013]|uniref:hypothetical protein n=1 Tax=Amycolatopsis sp. CB00013 TaxID=1703945 RepID=UPI000938A8B0|nr:hypothetical protein [Amycolatopsis sp. CB00013]
MTNEQLFEDLKQFVTTTVSQSEQRLGDRLDGMDKRFDSIDNRLDTIDRRFDAVDDRLDAMDQRFNDIDEQLDEIQNAVGSELAKMETAVHDLDRRVRRLDGQAA